MVAYHGALWREYFSPRCLLLLHEVLHLGTCMHPRAGAVARLVCPRRVARDEPGRRPHLHNLDQVRVTRATLRS